MRTTIQKPDYIKLFVRASYPLHDAEAASCAPATGTLERYVTTWTFHFATKGQKANALLAAQAKRTELQNAHPDLTASAFRLATYRVGSIRGVPGVGVLSADAAMEPELRAVAS